MKKKLFILAAAFAAIFSSCAKQELASPEEGEMEFNAFIEDDSKTALGNKSGSTYPLTWSAGDKICVNGQMSDELSAGSGTKNATFKVGKLGTATSYNVTYPGKAGSDNVAAFPTTVSRTAPVLPMYATASSRSFTMNHLAGVLRLSFTSSTTLKINSIELVAPGGEALGGEMTIGKTGTALNGTLSGGQSSISFDCGSGISLSGTAASIMVPVPAGTYSQGIKITLTDDNQGSMVIVVLNNNGTLGAGKVLEFNTVAYVSDISSEDLYLIYNTSTLQNFISSVNGGNNDAKIKNARVTANFTVSSSDAAALEEVDGYLGVFDGNNKTITGLQKPLFSTLYGQVKNLTLNSTLNVTDDDSYGTGIFVRLMNTSDLVDEPSGLYGCTAKGSLTWDANNASGDRAVGGLAGRVQGGIISGCENQATVTTTGTMAEGKQLMLGGVMGRGLKDSFYGIGSNVSGCANSGLVNYNGSAKNAYIGGVCGYDVESVCSTSNCSNTGTVQIGENGYGNPINLGGVIGLSAGALDDLSNSGTVQTLWSGSNSPFCYIGGVVGRTSTTSKTLTNLKLLSDGKVLIGGKGYTMFIGGVVGWVRGGKAEGWDCAGKVTIDGGAYTVCAGGLVGIAGNRKYAKTEGGDGSKHMTFTDCTVSSTAVISTSADASITSSDAANDNALAVGGMFGRITEGLTLGGNSSFAGSVNIVPITMADANQPWCIGGIVGYASVLSNAATNTGIEFNGVVNTGSVTLAEGSNTKYAVNKVGGIIGWAKLYKSGAPIVLTDCVNKGTVSLVSADTKASYLGGIAGFVETTANMSEIRFVRCINGDSSNSSLGAVNNSGSAGGDDMILAGICSKIVGASGVPITLQGCKNYGPITNSGNSTWTYSSAVKASWGVISAGIIGRAQDNCILSATSTTDANRNINYGTITDNSESKAPCLAGVVGALAGTGSAFEYCENRGMVQFTGASCFGAIVGGVAGHINSISNIDYTSNYGDVKVLGNPDSKTTGKFFMLGGIMAMIQDNASHDFSISHATNEGNISLSNVELNKTGAQIFVGGCVGDIGFDSTSDNPQNFSYLTNRGSVKVSALDNSGPTTSWNYVAGILAANYDYKFLDHCTNEGAVECGNDSGGGPNRINIKARVGGIAAYLTMAPTNCFNKGSVTVCKAYEGSVADLQAACNVGGIAGYLEKTTTLDGLSSTGNVTTSGSSHTPHIGGLIGYTNTVTTVTNCTVGGYINGGGTTNGGFFLGPGASGLTFTDCHLKKGSRIKNKSTDKTYNTVGATLSNSDWFVRPSSSYTVTNCTVIN